jgi:hypothetical protein
MSEYASSRLGYDASNDSMTWITADNRNSNAGVYLDINTGYTYYGGEPYWYWGDPYPYGTNEPYRPRPVYPWQESPPVTVITKIVEVPAPEPQENNRKEISDMINAKQTFLDALADEGKPLTSEERDIVRDAKPDKLELLFARLLARVFEPADLAVLKEKPKEVLVREA